MSIVEKCQIGEFQNTALVEEVQIFLSDKGLSENTVTTYCRNIKLFLEWYNKEVDSKFSGLTDRIVKNYFKYLESYIDSSDKHYSLSSIKAKLTATQVLSDFLFEVYSIPRIIIPQKKGQIDPKVDILEKNELNRFLHYVDRNCDLLQKCVIELLLNTGIRCTELCSIELNDVEISARKGLLTIRSGKGGKYRQIPLNADARRSITAYLAIRPNTVDTHLLIGQRGKMTRSGIYNIVSNISKKAIGKSIHPHTLRHQCLTAISKNGTDLKTVSEIAGHSNINTTSRFYVATSFEDKQNALDSLSF